MAEVQASQQDRDNIYNEAMRLQKAAVAGVPIPMPQRTALKGQGATLYEQWLELEAAYFNDAAAEYNSATEEIRGAIADLQEVIDDIEDAIRVVERATALIKAVDGLLKLAIRFASIAM